MYEWYYLWISALELYIGTLFLCPFFTPRVHMDLCSSIMSWYKLQLALKACLEAYADGYSHMQSLMMCCHWSVRQLGVVIQSRTTFILKTWESFCKWFWLYLLILEYV